MELSKLEQALEQDLITALVDSGCEKEEIIQTMMIMPTKEQRATLLGWIDWYSKHFGKYPYSPQIQESVATILTMIPTPEDEEILVLG